MFSRRNQILFAMAHSAMLKRGETVRKQTEAEQKSDPAIRNRAMAALEKMAGHTIREEKPDGPPPPPKVTGTAPPPPPAAGSSPPPPPSTGTAPPPPPGGDMPEGQVADDESADDGSARLLLLAMVRAAQADNRVEQGEKDIIFARLAEAGLTQRDQWFIEDELRKTQPLGEWTPAIPAALAGDVYAVSLMTIGQPNLAERRYLQALAEHLSLDKARIDDLTEQFLNAS